jgi:acetoin:2,6-dichlorophenolindophenol oxidoreductase subunit beta
MVMVASMSSRCGLAGHIPGLTVIVPSTPSDAGGLMLAALQYDGPVLFLEHKLFSESWLEFLGSGGRATVQYDVPADGVSGVVPRKWEPMPIGKAHQVRCGDDVTLVSVGVGVHRALAAAEMFEREGVSEGVLALRTVSLLDREQICETAVRTNRLLVIDEDYEGFGLSGEVAAVVLEAGISVKFGRVCTQTTIPYARHLEDQALPNVERICNGIRYLL